MPGVPYRRPCASGCTGEKRTQKSPLQTHPLRHLESAVFHLCAASRTRSGAREKPPAAEAKHQRGRAMAGHWWGDGGHEKGRRRARLESHGRVSVGMGRPQRALTRPFRKNRTYLLRHVYKWDLKGDVWLCCLAGLGTTDQRLSLVDTPTRGRSVPLFHASPTRRSRTCRHGDPRSRPRARAQSHFA